MCCFGKQSIVKKKKNKFKYTQSRKSVKIIKYFSIQSSKMLNILDYHVFLMRYNAVEVYFPNIVLHDKYYT